jgi:hypothetical protein
VNTGLYSHISKIELDEGERKAACDIVKREIAERGFASLSSIDVSTSIELNPTISETALLNALFQVCFADGYEKRGKIITRKGDTLNALAILKDYCLSNDCLTLEELQEFEKEISGYSGVVSLTAAYEVMVRVDKNTFVSDSEISFDVKAVDDALSLFVHANVIPLQSVTSFTSFPYIDGCSWNLYLLESFCKRFSQQFIYLSLSVNNQNVGAICRKSIKFTDYLDALVSVVAISDIELTEEAVGNYLFESKYIARKTGSVQEIVEKARILRERVAV